jgi:predicted esterase
MTNKKPPPPPQEPDEEDPLPELKKTSKHWFDPEATTITQFDADGLPMGMSSGYTRVFAYSPMVGDSLRYVVVSMWAVILALTLYSARDVQAVVLRDESLSGGVVMRVADGFYAFARAIGPAYLREVLDNAFSTIKQKTPSFTPMARGSHEGPAGSSPDEAGGEPVEPPIDAKQPGRPGLLTEQSKDTNARVLLVGASSMQFYLGAELERRLERYRGIATLRFGKLGTGLAQPDNFSWPKHLPELLSGFRPTVVIGQFGGNDGQPLALASGVAQFGTDEWRTEYASRVKHIVEMVQASGAKMVMIGMPVTLHKGITKKLEIVNEVTRTTTESLGGVYISTWDIAADADGKARQTITYEGKSGPMYLPDGIHYARVGAAFVSELLSRRIERELRLKALDVELAQAQRFDMKSGARQKNTSYLAFVPQGLPEGKKLPVLFLLHGAGGSWTDFSDHMHDKLQSLASLHQLVLVTPDGDPDGWYVDSPILPGSNVATFIANELLADVEHRLPVTKRRGIAGISMGGNGAVAIAINSPGTFVSVSSLSGAIDLTAATDRRALIERLGPYEQNRELWRGTSAFQLFQSATPAAKKLKFYFSIGTSDRWLGANNALHEMLTSLKVPHKFEASEGGHAWSYWAEEVPKHIAWHAAQLGGVGVEAAAP